MSAAAVWARMSAYCGDPAGEAWLRPRVDAARHYVVDSLRDVEVQGLILTGSLARGEASVLPLNGGVKLLGDMEFLLIVRPQRRWRDFRRRVAELSKRASEVIGGSPDGFSIEFTPATRSYLRERARPTMFTYDLRYHGRVLVGAPDLLEELPRVERAGLLADDAMETLVNRGLELLAFGSAHPRLEARGYVRAKVLLDLAGSALAFSGAYESLYSRRPAAFRALLARRCDLRDQVQGIERLARLVEEAARIKLEPTPDGLARIAGDAEAQTLLGWAIDLWRWEASQSLGRNDTDLSTLIPAYLAAEGCRSRLRGWVRYMWHPLRPPGAGPSASWPRLMMLSSPRRLVYAAALLAIDGAPGWEGQAVRLLPRRPDEPEAVRRAIVGTWTWLLRNN